MPLRPSTFPRPSAPPARLFPGQSVAAFGLNPTGGRFIARRLVTHVPPPPPSAALLDGLTARSGPTGSGPVGAAWQAGRGGGLSLVAAAGPFSLGEELCYEPLEALLAHCTGALMRGWLGHCRLAQNSLARRPRTQQLAAPLPVGLLPAAPASMWRARLGTILRRAATWPR